eukprot:contig_3402_g718
MPELKPNAQPPPPPPALVISVELDESQLRVVRTVADAFGGPRVGCVLVTGPPGTGRTRTIQGIAMELIWRGSGCGGGGAITTRLLLVSRTNAACDHIVSALMSLHTLLEGHDWGRHYLESLSQAFGPGSGARMPVLLRVGLEPPMGDPIAATHIDAVLEDHPPRVYPDVVRRQEAAAAAYEDVRQRLTASGSNEETSFRDARSAGDELLEANGAVKKSVRRLHSQVARGPPIVVTTTASSTGNAIRNLGYHAIIVDEAASTSIPAALSAEVRAAGELGDEAANMTRCVVLMGDPAQLPPSSGMRYTGDVLAMGDSVFERLPRYHPQLTLTHQHRMRPIFWTTVGSLDNRRTRKEMMRFTRDRQRMSVMLSGAEAHLHVVGDTENVAQSDTPWDAWWAGVFSGRWGAANLELLHKLMHTRTALRHLDQLFLILVIRYTVLTQQQTNLTAATNAQDHFLAPDDHDSINRYASSSSESSAVVHHTCAV